EVLVDAVQHLLALLGGELEPGHGQRRLEHRAGDARRLLLLQLRPQHARQQRGRQAGAREVTDELTSRCSGRHAAEYGSTHRGMRIAGSTKTRAANWHDGTARDGRLRRASVERLISALFAVFGFFALSAFPRTAATISAGTSRACRRCESRCA